MIAIGSIAFAITPAVIGYVNGDIPLVIVTFFVLAALLGHLSPVFIIIVSLFS